MDVGRDHRQREENVLALTENAMDFWMLEIFFPDHIDN